jgi:hypothetical protein
MQQILVTNLKHGTGLSENQNAVELDPSVPYFT